MQYTQMLNIFGVSSLVLPLAGVRWLSFFCHVPGQGTAPMPTSGDETAVKLACYYY